MKRRAGTVLAGIVVLGVGGVLVARAILGAGAEPAVRAHHVADIRQGDLERMISASGTLRAREDVRHRFAQGGRIEEIFVEEGQPVPEGYEMMRLEAHQQELNLIQARNAYQDARIGGREADVEAQRARVAAAERELAARTLTARIGGTVAELEHREGDSLDPGTVAFRIVDTSAFVAAIDIDESDSRHLEIGQNATVEMDALPGETFAGRVTWLSATARTQAGVVVVSAEITLDEVRDAFRPGYSVDAGIVVETAHDELIVPITAVFEENGREHVVVVDDAGVPQVTEVQTGLDDGLNMVIESGLTGDERILVNAYQYAGLVDDGLRFPPRPGGPGSGGPDDRTAEAAE